MFDMQKQMSEIFSHWVYHQLFLLIHYMDLGNKPKNEMQVGILYTNLLWTITLNIIEECLEVII